MKGTILGFDASKSEGMIRGEDEKRYPFAQSEFNAEQTPTSGLGVDFDVIDGAAKDIYIVQKVVSQGGSMQDMQAKAANMVGDISNNADVIKAKDTLTDVVSSNPISLALIAIYVIAVFLPLMDIKLGRGWNLLGSIEVSFFEITLGKVALVAAIAMLVLIILEKIKYLKLLVVLMLLLPGIGIINEIHSLQALIEGMGVRIQHNAVFKAFTSHGIGIGVYILPISALILLFVPLKKQGGKN